MDRERGYHRGMSGRKKAILLTIACMATILTGGCGKVNVGYVDGERVIKEAPQLKTIMDEGNEKLLTAELEAEEALKNTEGKSDEEIQKMGQDAQRKLMGINQQYATKLQQTLDTALADIAKERKLDAVVDNIEEQKTVILGGIDVTDDVIQKLQ